MKQQGASPSSLIAALQKADDAIAEEQAEGLKRGIDLDRNSAAAGYRTSKQLITRNLDLLAFLNSF